ncbi:hypothetical protein NA56DRAFT_756286 [Hyaloscypha hepaticicola]|uniref:Tc1-like transposase DDE domain-containing protein n=1 Tax=Hyaloscypha hepaticicola TaxID=2082293 RepID=A0A2J6PFH2_9HELO|nr:hypothetical protein NA56DRAFT_756286 [Hyaloscypha hepaticicola]
MPIGALETRYHLGNSTIRRILSYDAPERARPIRTGRPQLLTDQRVDKIIKYCAESWDHRVLKYEVLIEELQLPCTPEHLAVRLKQRGYFRCTACQKPFLTAAQVIGRFLWAIAHIFWHEEWLKVLWLDEHQLHRGHTTPVHAWGAIGYGYKSPLLFIHGSGKSGAFTQKDYLAQVLAPHIQPILEAFAAITHLLRPIVEPLFMEDGNSAHGRKSARNCYARWRTAHGVILMPHPSTSPDMNPIEKCWRRINRHYTDESTNRQMRLRCRQLY